MEIESNYVRSNLLLSRRHSALLIVDVQEKLVSVIQDRQRLLWNLRRLTDGARALGIPILAIEQYPEKLGPTIDGLLDPGSPVPAKMSFSGCGNDKLREQLKQIAPRQIVVVGIESHVCVLQTTFDLLAESYEVYVAADAISARYEIDHEIALRRMEICGVNLTTVEAALFEWCEVAGTAEFKQISQIVRRLPSDTA